MAYLPLSPQQQALLDSFNAKLDQAFEFGVSDPVSVQPLDNYNDFRSFKDPTGLVATDVTPNIKQMALAAFAATLVAGFEVSWNLVELTSPWTGFALYYKDPFGKVHLRGQVLGGTENSTITQFPAPIDISYLPAAATISSAAVATYLIVGGDGHLITPPSPSGTYTMFSLDGLSYFAK